MATTIIAKNGDAISVHPGRHDVYWCFSINVERYTYKTVPPRYNSEIVAEKRGHNQDPEKLTVFRSNRGDLSKIDEAYKLLQSLLDAINNQVPAWDIRDLL